MTTLEDSDSDAERARGSMIRRRVPGGFRNRGLGGIGAAVAFLVLGRLLPSGLPFGVVLLGLVLGSLNALTALGLVLIYRATRVINFAQASIGGLASAVAVVMVTGWHVPYFVALPVGLVAALATGALTELIVVRRFFSAPRLLLTVATIGVGQIVGALTLFVPHLVAHLSPLTAFKTPFRFHHTIGPVLFTGDHLVAVAVVSVVAVLLTYFFAKTDIGVAIRASADSQERAVLLGVPVRLLSLISWTVAAGLSGLGAMLSTPILGVNLGAVAGPTVLLAPLSAAVVARMDNLAAAFAWALTIGVAEQAIFWSYPRSSVVDLGLFVLVLIALLVQRPRESRLEEAGLGSHAAGRDVRKMPEVLRRLPEVRVVGALGLVALAAVVLVVIPLTFTPSHLFVATIIAIYCIIAVSLVPLAGWAGQISLGQFAFVGVGAATTGTLLVHHNVDLFVALLASTVVGAAIAVLIGIPALRVPGLFLAVATLAFAVPVSTFLLSSLHFPQITPTTVERPLLFSRVSIDSPRVFYLLCVSMLIFALGLTHNLRRTRAGRIILAVRDNDRVAAAFSVSPLRAKLIAFLFSGALAGLAGGLYVLAVHGIAFSGFDPAYSINVFVMVVVGGLSTMTGAILGVLYVELVQYFLHGAAQLLATGGGLLLLLLVVPGGLGQIVFDLRDRGLSRLANRRGIEVSGVREVAQYAPGGRPVDGRDLQDRYGGSVGAGGQTGLLCCDGVDVSYGSLQVLFGVNLAVDRGELVALLGTNGAGKSTILRAICGLMSPNQGRVHFDGVDITDLSPLQRVKMGIVTVPGGRGIFGTLTVADNIRVAGWRARRDGRQTDDVVAHALRLFPALGRRWEAKASTLSGGEQQMLTIAQALMCAPQLLLIDELSLGLAPVVVATLLDAVRQLNRDGVTIIVVEQSVNVATTLAHRAVFMERGQVRFTGPTADLVDRPDLLRSVFLSGSGPSPIRVASPPAIRPTEEAPALSVEDVGKRFGGVTSLTDVSFDVAQGQILGIIGSNGAGKTTLFDVCSGFLRPDGGRVILAGRDVTELGPASRAARGMGRVFQDARLFSSLTVSECLAVALERHIDVRDPLLAVLYTNAVDQTERKVAERVDELVTLMNLGRYRNAFISELSTGTRRVVELGCAMAHRPDVLLLDEPSSGIAQRETEALAELLMTLRATTGVTMVVIEHDIPLVTAISSELVCLHLGEVIARGIPADVLSDPGVIASYLGENDVTVHRSNLGGGGRRGTARHSPDITTLSTREYALQTGQSVSAVHRAIQAGHLPAHRVGRVWRVDALADTTTPELKGRQGR